MASQPTAGAATRMPANLHPGARCADSIFAAAAFRLTEAAGWDDVPGVERVPIGCWSPFRNASVPGIACSSLRRTAPIIRDLQAVESWLPLPSDGPLRPIPISRMPGITWETGTTISAICSAPPMRLPVPLAAFERARALDPDSGGPREHIIDFHVVRRDTAALLRLQRARSGATLTGGGGGTCSSGVITAVVGALAGAHGGARPSTLWCPGR